MFKDKMEISLWAREMMAWGIYMGITSGDNNYLYPTDTGTRAVVATIFQRFIEKMENK